MRPLRRWKKLWRRSLTLTQEVVHGAFQTLLEQYKCIAAGGDYFEGGLEFNVCTINKSAHTKKKSLETYLMILVFTIKPIAKLKLRSFYHCHGENYFKS